MPPTQTESKPALGCGGQPPSRAYHQAWPRGDTRRCQPPPDHAGRSAAELWKAEANPSPQHRHPPGGRCPPAPTEPQTARHRPRNRGARSAWRAGALPTTHRGGLPPGRIGDPVARPDARVPRRRKRGREGTERPAQDPEDHIDTRNTQTLRHARPDVAPRPGREAWAPTGPFERHLPLRYILRSCPTRGSVDAPDGGPNPRPDAPAPGAGRRPVRCKGKA